MSKVIAGLSMSLDDFVADPDDGVDQVFKWYSAGGTDAEVMAGDGTFEMSREGAEFIEEAGRGAGVLVTARRTFDLAHAWGGKHPMDVPMVVVTHGSPRNGPIAKGHPSPSSPRVSRRPSTWHGRSPVTRTSWSALQRHLAVPATRAPRCHPHRPRAGGAGTRDTALRSPDQPGRAPHHRGFREPAHHAYHLPGHQVARQNRQICVPRQWPSSLPTGSAYSIGICGAARKRHAM
jgi:hypothetical protein